MLRYDRTKVNQAEPYVNTITTSKVSPASAHNAPRNLFVYVPDVIRQWVYCDLPFANTDRLKENYSRDYGLP